MDLLRSESFKSHVEELMRQQHIPGLSIAIVHSDEIASAGFGQACLEPPEPCTADTLFDIASSSKSLTAASVALLIDDDENHPDIQYESVMSHLLPDDFVITGAGYTEGVTVEDILSHRSGMASHDNSYLGPRASKPDDARSITRNLRNLPVAAPIRSKYLYCNMMYTVASYLVEVKSQQTFSAFLEDRLFRPLGMNSSSLQPESARSKGFGDRIATGYFWEEEGAKFHDLRAPDCTEGQGAGSIITSANDLIKWVKALLKHGDPINERVYAGLVRGRTLANPDGKDLEPYSSPIVYAAGMEFYYYRGHMVVAHDGAISGFGSRFFFLPEFDFGAVFLGNSGETDTLAQILTRELIDEVVGVPVEQRGECKKAEDAVPETVASLARDEQNHSPGEEKKGNEAEDDGKTSQALKKSQDSPEPQHVALETYTGKYTHPGYHEMIVQIKDDKLFIDATYRSMGFTLTFEHISGQTRYIAHFSDVDEGGDDPIHAEFVIEDQIATRMGLHIEEALKEMIWFDRVTEG